MTQSNPSELLRLAVIQAAKSLVEAVEPEKQLGDAPDVPLRTLKRIWRRQQFVEMALLLWEREVCGMLTELLRDQGLDLATAGIDLDGLRPTFVEAFWVFSEARFDKLDDLDALTWQQLGTDPDLNTGWPTSHDARNHGYALVYDPEVESIVYVGASDADNFGLAQRWTGEVWLPHNRLPLTFAGRPVQPFRGVYDSGRNGVACWTMVDDGGSSRALGVVVSGDRADLVDHQGDVPSGSTDPFDFGVIFGFDPARGVTLALGHDTIWELDAAGQWRTSCDTPGDMVCDRWYPGTSGAVYDGTSQQLLVHWTDWKTSTTMIRCWDGQALRPVAMYGLPDRIANRCGVTFYRDAGGRARAFSGKKGYSYVRKDDGWELTAENASAVPQFAGVQAAFDPERGHLMLGPGDYDTGAQRRFANSFYLRPGDGTRFERRGAAPMATGSADRWRLLALHRDALWAIDEQWTLSREAKDGTWETVTRVEGVGESVRPLALVDGGDAGLWLVADGGGVMRWRDGAIESLAGNSAVFGDRRGPAIAFDRRRGCLVAWGGTDGDAQSVDTLLFRRDAWLEEPTLELPLPADRLERRRRNRDESSVNMLWDEGLDALLLVVGKEVFVLTEEGWQAADNPSLAIVDREQVLIAHDPRSKATLAVCFGRTGARISRVHGGGEVSELDAPNARVELQRTNPERPWAADWVVDHERRLRLFPRDDLSFSFAFPLGATFDAARATDDTRRG